MSTRGMVWFLIAMLDGLGAACAARVAPGRFVRSAAYRRSARSTYGVLQASADSSMADWALAVHKDDEGRFVAESLRHDGKTLDGWTPLCQSAAVEGDELLRVAYAGDDAAPKVLLVCGEQNPEEFVQNVAVIDASSCVTIFAQTVTLPRFEAMPSTSLGIGLCGARQTLCVDDEPEWLALSSASGTYRLPVRCRRRCARLDALDALSWQEGTRGLLVETPVMVHGREAAPNGVLPAGEDIRLELKADLPLAVLEIRHGCEAEGEVASLSLRVGTLVYDTDAVPRPGSFVAASGRRHDERPYRADLLALAEPATHLEIDVIAAGQPRCLHEIVGYTLQLRDPLTSGACQ